MDELTQLIESAKADFAAATQPAALEDAKARYLGKSGAVTMLMKGLGALAPEERKERGKAINAVKQAIDAALTARREALANAELEKKLATEAVDVTLPGRVVPAGGVHPVIPEKGSLGASGDLAPLAHIVLVMLGEGEAEYQGRVMPGREAMAAAGIDTIQLAAKEGLALINGTQIMTAIAFLYFVQEQCDIVSLEVGLGGRFDATNVIDTPEAAAISPRCRRMTTQSCSLRPLPSSCSQARRRWPHCAPR